MREILNQRLKDPRNRAEAEAIYPLPDGVYEEEPDPIVCGQCGAEIPELGSFPENWEWGEDENLCPACKEAGKEVENAI